MGAAQLQSALKGRARTVAEHICRRARTEKALSPSTAAALVLRRSLCSAATLSIHASSSFRQIPASVPSNHPRPLSPLTPQDFNAKTALYKQSALMRVHLTAFDDRTFKYSIAAPSATWYLKRVTGLAKGAASPGKEVVGNVSLRALYEIAMSKKKVGACGGRGGGGGILRALHASPHLHPHSNPPHLQFDPKAAELGEEGIVKCLIGTARGMGLKVVA